MVEGWPARLVGEENGRNGWVGYAVQTAGNAGSELLIFVPRAAHSHDLWAQNSPRLGKRPALLRTSLR